MSRLGLRGKLLLIILPPLIGLVYFSIQQVRQDWGVLREARTVGVLDELVVDLSVMMEAFNIERAAAFNFGGPNFAIYADDWKNQPAKTDATTAKLRETVARLDREQLRPDLVAGLDSLSKEIDKLPAHRKQVEQAAIKPIEALDFYRRMGNIAMTVVTEAARMPNSAEISNYFASIVFLMRSTDAVAQARLPLRVAFDNGTFKGMEKNYLDAAQLATRDRTQFDNMLAYASQQQRALAQEMRSSQAIQEAERMEAYGLNNPTAEKFEIKGMEFRAKQNEKMIAYSKLRNRYLDDMLKLVNEHAFAAQVRIAVTLGVSVLAIAVALVLAGFVSWDLLRTTDHVVMDLNAASRQTLSASQQVSTSSQSLAAGASQQASSIQETSSTLDQIAVATKRNAEDAAQAENLAQEAQNHSKAGTQAMARMIDAIQSIKQASDQTAKINKTIDEIAFQTNLLALNAAVEAARAGEAGRGFAVVAEEVRNLATRSAEAARDTSALIEDSRRRADQGVAMSSEVNASLSAIQTTFDKMNSLVRNVASASREQNGMVQNITQAIAEMDNIIQTNAAGAEETAAASEELSAQAESLSGVVNDLTRIMRGQNGRQVEFVETPAPAHGANRNGNGAAKPSQPAPAAKPASNLRKRIEQESAPTISALPVDLGRAAQMKFRDLPDSKS